MLIYYPEKNTTKKIDDTWSRPRQYAEAENEFGYGLNKGGGSGIGELVDNATTFVKEPFKATVTSSIRTLGSIGALIESTGETMANDHLKNVGRALYTTNQFNQGAIFKGIASMYFKNKDFEGVDKNKLNSAKDDWVYRIGDSLDEFGDEWHYKVNNFADEFLPPDPDIFRGTFMQNPSWTRAASAVAAAIPSLFVAAAVTGITKNPMAGALILSSTESIEQRKEARESGMSVDNANLLFKGALAGNTLLEMIGLDTILDYGLARKLAKMPMANVKRFVKNEMSQKGIGKIIQSIKNGIIDGTVEGVQEGTQQVFQNAVAKFGYDETRDYTEGLAESLIGGAGSGGFIGAISTNGASRLDQAIETLEKRGATKEELDVLMNETTDLILKNAGVIDEQIIRMAKGEEVADNPDYPFFKKLGEWEKKMTPSQILESRKKMATFATKPFELRYQDAENRWHKALESTRFQNMAWTANFQERLKNFITHGAMIQYTTKDIKSKKGGRVLAAAMKDGVVYLNEDEIAKTYKEKAWTKPKVKGVEALDPKQFKNKNQWRDFLIAHEQAHIDSPKGTNESAAAYENRMNKVALETMGTLNEQTISKKAVRELDELIQLKIDFMDTTIEEVKKQLGDNHPELLEKIIRAKNLDSKYDPLVKEVQARYQRIYDFVNGRSKNKIGYVKNYVSRRYVPRTHTDNEPRLDISTRHIQERQFKNLAEAVVNGYYLRYNTASNNVFDYANDITGMVADTEFVETLRTIGKRGETFLTSKNLEGYVKLEAPMFDSVEGDASFAPKQYAKALNNMTTRSKLEGALKIPGTKFSVVDFVTKYNAIAKAVRLTSQLFHHVAFCNSYMFGTLNKLGNSKSIKEAWNSVNPLVAYKHGLAMIRECNPVLHLGVQNGLTFGRIQDWNERLLHEKSALGKLMDKWNVSRDAKNGLLALRENYTHFLFNKLGAGLKAMAFVHEFTHAQAKNPNVDPNIIAREVADLMNDDFGGLNLKRMHRNPTMQHVNRLLWLGSDWTESNIRSIVKVFHGDNKRHQQLYQRFWAGILMKGVIVNILGNMAMAFIDRDDEDASMFESLVENYVDAWESGHLNVLGIYVNPICKLFGYKPSDDYYLNPIGHFLDPFKWMTRGIKKGKTTSGAFDELVDPQRLSLGLLKSAYYKSSMAAKPIWDIAKGTDYTFARKFTTWDELTGEKKIPGNQDTKLVKWKKKDEPYELMQPDQFPSYGLYQLKQLAPVPINTAWEFFFGQMEGIEAITKTLGLDVRRSYNRFKSKK